MKGNTRLALRSKTGSQILDNVRLKQFLWAKIRNGENRKSLNQHSTHRIQERKKLSTYLLTADQDRRGFWRMVRGSKKTSLGMTGLMDKDGKVFFDLNRQGVL